jgi:hypothetical protein
MHHHLTVALSVFAVLGACNGKNKDAPSESARKSADIEIEPMAKPAKDERKPTGTPRPQSKLAVTVDGKPVEMATALAWKHWDGMVKLTASSVPVGCDEVTGDMRWLHDGEVTFDLDLAYGLQPDGSLKPEQRYIYFEGMTLQKTAPVTATGDGTPGQPTTVDVELETTSAKGKKLTVKGTIDALGCAAKPRKDAPALPPEQPAKITIAGKTFPVRFAKFSKSGDVPSVKLFTGAESCETAAFATPSEVTVDLTWFPSGKGQVSQVDLGGSLVSRAADQTFDKKKLVVKPPPTGAGEIELAGDIEVAGYPLKLEGKVTVTECAK